MPTKSTFCTGSDGTVGADGKGCGQRSTHIRPHVKQIASVREKKFSAHEQSHNNNKITDDKNQTMIFSGSADQPSLSKTTTIAEALTLQVASDDNSMNIIRPQEGKSILKPPDQRKYNAATPEFGRRSGDDSSIIDKQQDSERQQQTTILPLKEACVKDLVIERKPEPMLPSAPIDFQTNTSDTLVSSSSTAVEGYVPRTGISSSSRSTFQDYEKNLIPANMVLEREEEQTTTTRPFNSGGYDSMASAISTNVAEDAPMNTSYDNKTATPGLQEAFISDSLPNVPDSMASASTSTKSTPPSSSPSYSVADLLARKHKFDEECFELENVDVSFQCMSPEQYQKWQEHEEEERRNGSNGNDGDFDGDDMSCTSTTESSSTKSGDETSKLLFRYIIENDDGHDNVTDGSSTKDIDPRLATKLSIGHSLFDNDDEDGDDDNIQGDWIDDSSKKEKKNNDSENDKVQEDSGLGDCCLSSATNVREMDQYKDEEEGDDADDSIVDDAIRNQNIEMESTLPEPPPRAFIKIWKAFSGWVTPEATAAVTYFQKYPLKKNSSTEAQMETDEESNKDDEIVMTDNTDVNDTLECVDQKSMNGNNENDMKSSAYSTSPSSMSSSPPPVLEHYQYDTSDVGCSRCGGLMSLMKLNLGKTLTELGLVEYRKEIQERIALLLMRFDFSDEMIKLDAITWRALTTIVVFVVCGFKVVSVPIIVKQPTSSKFSTGNTSLQSPLQLLPMSIVAAGLVEDEFKYLAQSALLSFN